MNIKVDEIPKKGQSFPFLAKGTNSGWIYLVLKETVGGENLCIILDAKIPGKVGTKIYYALHCLEPLEGSVTLSND